MSTLVQQSSEVSILTCGRRLLCGCVPKSNYPGPTATAASIQGETMTSLLHHTIQSSIYTDLAGLHPVADQQWRWSQAVSTPESPSRVGQVSAEDQEEEARGRREITLKINIPHLTVVVTYICHISYSSTFRDELLVLGLYWPQLCRYKHFEPPNHYSWQKGQD